MSTPRPLCSLLPGSLWALLLALLVGTPGGRAQTAPSYRPPATSSAASPATASSSSPAQCAASAGPAGGTSVSRGNGTVPAPHGAQPSYSQTALNLSNYAVGGLLTVQITAGSGSSPTTFELFPAGTTFPANGTPSSQPLASATNVAPGNCATLALNFSRAGSFILAATGTSGSNMFQYAAYVQPSFTGVFSATPAAPPAGTQSNQPPQATASQAAQPAQPSSPTQSPQGPGLFTGVFTPTPANQPTQAAAPAQPPAQAVQAALSANAQPAAPSPASPAPNTPAPASPAPAQPSSPAPSQPASPSSTNTPQMIQSVTIQNSPGVPDTGGHSILGGLLRGSLTAVEPNLVLCVTPSGGAAGARSCTGICNPGHDCNAPLQRGVTLAATPSVHVEVLDNDKQGKTTPLAAFDQSDATQCTTAQPCTQMVPDPTSSDPNGTELSISFGFATPQGCDTSAAGIWTQGPVLLASTRILPGVLPAQTFVKGEGCTASTPIPGCHGPYESIEAAMQSDSYAFDALSLTVASFSLRGLYGHSEYGFLILRDPLYSKQEFGTGGYYVSPPVQGTMSTAAALQVSLSDYENSQRNAACGANSFPEYGSWAATVHTHPSSIGLKYNSNFTANDFSSALQMKLSNPDTFEKIVMIYEEDRAVRTFIPTPQDCPKGAQGPGELCPYKCCPFGNPIPFSLGNNPTDNKLWCNWATYPRTFIPSWQYVENENDPAGLTVSGNQKQPDPCSDEK